MGFSSTRNGPGRPVEQRRAQRRQGADGDEKQVAVLADTHSKGPQTFDLSLRITPRERQFLLDAQNIDEQWSVTMSRAFRALELLEKRGYDMATFLGTVLKAVNDVLEGQPLHRAVRGDAYDRAVLALRRAQRHDPLRTLFRAQRVVHPDAACLLLKRAVVEMDGVMRSLATLDLRDAANVTQVRQKATEVILSVLGAEVQTALEKR